MIYNAESGLLYGITENCETVFGISAELVYGHPKNQFIFTIVFFFKLFYLFIKGLYYREYFRQEH